MSRGFTIEVDGGYELGLKFGKMEGKLERKVRRITRNRSYKIERQAKQSVPVDTGHLRRSIRTTFRNNDMTGIVGTNVNYAIYVEKGTVYMRPRPYLFPAFFINRSHYLTELNRILGETVKE